GGVPGASLSTSCNGGNNRHFIARLERGVFFLQESDVFLVDVDIYEPSQLPVVVAQTLFDAGMRCIPVVFQVYNGACGHLTFTLSLGQRSQRSRNPNFDHPSPPPFFPILNVFSKATRLG